MIKNTSEYPNSVPHVISFDVINNVVACNDLFVFVVYEALELDAFGLLLEIVLGKVVVDKGNDFGPVSCAVVLGWHEESAVNHLVGRKPVGYNRHVRV